MKSYKANAVLFASLVAIGGFLFGLDAAQVAGTTDFPAEKFSLTLMPSGNVEGAPALGLLDMGCHRYIYG